MSDTLKEFLKELDLPEELAEKPVAEIKDKFHEQFVSRKIADSDPDIVKNITGKTFSILRRQFGNEFGIEKEEYESLKFEDLIKKGASKTKEQIEALKKAAEGKGPDNKELETLTKERDQYKSMVETKDNEFTSFKQQAEQEKKGLMLGYHLTGLKSKIEWSDQATEIAKKGFDLHMAENFKFDFDETGNLLAFDKTGNKIENAKKTGFLGPDEIFKAEAAKHGLLKMSNPNPPKPPSPGGHDDTRVDMGNGQVRRLPKAAVENAM